MKTSFCWRPTSVDLQARGNAVTSCSASARQSLQASMVHIHWHTRNLPRQSCLTSSPFQLVTFAGDVRLTTAVVLELLALHHHILLLLHAELSLPGQHRPNSQHYECHSLYFQALATLLASLCCSRTVFGIPYLWLSPSSLRGKHLRMFHFYV